MGEEPIESEACGRGDGVAMETPQRNQSTTPMSKFEDSPVFNFINSLSPIKPVKSRHITQSFNSLNLTSLPSIFTSPHVSSLKESRLLKRHHFPDLSKPEFYSENGDKEAKNKGSDVALNPIQHQENIDPSVSVGEASVQSSYENSKLATEPSGALVYDYVSTDNSSTPCHVAETIYVSEMAGISSELVPFVQNVSGKGWFSSDMHVEGQIDQNKDTAGSDWTNLISDAADLLTFDSPNNAETFKVSGQKSMDSGMRFCSSFINDLPKIPDGTVGIGEQYETKNPSTQPGEGNYSNKMAEAQSIPKENPSNNCVAGGTSAKMDNESDSNLYRGMRRRCLVFEMAGARRKHLDGCSSSGQPDGNIPTNDKQLASIRPENDSLQCILPGIGLHLNALATIPKFNSAVNSEALACGGQVMSVPTPSTSFSSFPTGQELSNTSLAVLTSETNMRPLEDRVPIVEDASQASGYTDNEELNQSSPKKKRRKLENAGESEGCKRCNCKKSKCLKLYCECFAAGLYCVEPCSCLDCFNKPVYEDTVLATRKQIESRNPLAFAPKVIRSSDALPETRDELNKTPASARHKRGCNCKKSGCLKKYCECYQGGVGCSINCRCEGCKNAFGRKDGSTLIGDEADLEEEETETCEKTQLDTNLEKGVIQNVAQQNLEAAPPATPLLFVRQSIGLPFSSKSKPPRSLLSIGSSSGMSADQRLGKPNIFPPMSKLENNFKTIREDEIPEILQGNSSPSSVVKSTSPNSKRVSPPHCEFEQSPSRRHSRKLILKSIPSFPSLTPKH